MAGQVGSTNVATSSTTTLTAVYPQTPTTGNVTMIGVAVTNNASVTPTCTTPAGWAIIGGPTSHNNGTGRCTVWLFARRFLTGDSTTAPSFTVSAGVSQAFTTEWNGYQDPTVNIDVTNGTGSIGASPTLTGSGTTIADKDLVYCFYGMLNTASPGNATWSGSAVRDTDNTTSTCTAGDASYVQTPAGTIAPAVSLIDNKSANLITVALIPQLGPINISSFTTGTASSVTYGQTPTLGNVLVLFWGMSRGSATPPTCTIADTDWIDCNTPPGVPNGTNSGNGGVFVKLVDADDVSGGTSGPALTLSAGTISWIVFEVANVDTASIPDLPASLPFTVAGGSQSTGTPSSLPSNTIVTDEPNMYVVTGVVGRASFTAPSFGGGAIQEQHIGSASTCWVADEQVAASSTSITHTFSATNSLGGSGFLILSIAFGPPAANTATAALSLSASGVGSTSASAAIALSTTATGGTAGSAAIAFGETAQGGTAGTAAIALTVTGAGGTAGTAQLTLGASGAGSGQGTAAASIALAASGVGGTNAAAALTLAAAGSGGTTGSAAVVLAAAGSGSTTGSAAVALAAAGSGSTSAAATVQLSGSGQGGTAASGALTLGAAGSGGTTGAAAVALAAAGTAAQNIGSAAIAVSAAGTPQAVGSAAAALTLGASGLAISAASASINLASAGSGSTTGSAAVALGASGTSAQSASAALTFASSGVSGASSAAGVLSLAAAGTPISQGVGAAALSLNGSGVPVGKGTGSAQISFTASVTGTATGTGLGQLALLAAGMSAQSALGQISFTATGTTSQQALGQLALLAAGAARSIANAHIDLAASGIASRVLRDVRLCYTIGTDRWASTVGTDRWKATCSADRWQGSLGEQPCS